LLSISFWKRKNRYVDYCASYSYTFVRPIKVVATPKHTFFDPRSPNHQNYDTQNFINIRPIRLLPIIIISLITIVITCTKFIAWILFLSQVTSIVRIMRTIARPSGREDGGDEIMTFPIWLHVGVTPRHPMTSPIGNHDSYPIRIDPHSTSIFPSHVTCMNRWWRTITRRFE
jgi:hypothetical protein